MVFIGPVLENESPKDGETAKNQVLYKYFVKKYYKIFKVDTFYWKKNFIVIIKLLYSIIFLRKWMFIISISTISAYKLTKILYFFKIRKLSYFVIGDTLRENIDIGKFNTKYYNIYNKIFVESKKTVDFLIKHNFNNVEYLPNLKECNNLFEMTHKNYPDNNEIIKFVFLSRIIPEKGVLKIIEAVEILNTISLESKFKVSFYGPINNDFEKIFYNKIIKFDNIIYLGYLDLSQKKGYYELGNYDVLMFPTYWKGEGFPGVIIDAFICGLPIIASDWNINSEFVIEGYNGFLIKSKNTIELAEKMKYIIENPHLIKDLSYNAKEDSYKYDVNINLNKYFS